MATQRLLFVLMRWRAGFAASRGGMKIAAPRSQFSFKPPAVAGVVVLPTVVLKTNQQPAFTELPSRGHGGWGWWNVPQLQHRPPLHPCNTSQSINYWLLNPATFAHEVLAEVPVRGVEILPWLRG
jgi:hypothetical protein